MESLFLQFYQCKAAFLLPLSLSQSAAALAAAADTFRSNCSRDFTEEVLPLPAGARSWHTLADILDD